MCMCVNKTQSLIHEMHDIMQRECTLRVET